MTPSTGNVFEDVGFPPDEARRLFLQSELAIAIVLLIERRGLSQSAAAKLFGVTQPRVNGLLRNKLDRFSIDTLIMMLSRGGVTVELSLQPRAVA